jgi:hypothetical protein
MLLKGSSKSWSAKKAASATSGSYLDQNYRERKLHSKIIFGLWGWIEIIEKNESRVGDFIHSRLISFITELLRLLVSCGHVFSNYKIIVRIPFPSP